jgi:hypothetical protein
MLPEKLNAKKKKKKKKKKNLSIIYRGKDEHVLW